MKLVASAFSDWDLGGFVARIAENDTLLHRDYVRLFHFFLQRLDVATVPAEKHEGPATLRDFLREIDGKVSKLIVKS